MAAPNRSRAKIDHDRAVIADLYLNKKMFQVAIAEELGMTPQMVSYDLRVLRKLWRNSALFDMDEAKGKELARVDRLELTYWEAWERSIEDRKIEGREAADKLEGGQATERRTKVHTRTEGRDGNPQFLQGVQWCINKRCELLGLDAVQEEGPSIGAHYIILGIREGREPFGAPKPGSAPVIIDAKARASNALAKLDDTERAASVGGHA